jgi:hypothetical protein
MSPASPGGAGISGQDEPALSNVLPPAETLTVELVGRRFKAYAVTDSELAALRRSSIEVPLSFFTLCVGAGVALLATLLSQPLHGASVGVFAALFAVATLMAIFFGILVFRAGAIARGLSMK